MSDVYEKYNIPTGRIIYMESNLALKLRTNAKRILYLTGEVLQDCPVAYQNFIYQIRHDYWKQSSNSHPDPTTIPPEYFYVNEARQFDAYITQSSKTHDFMELGFLTDEGLSMFQLTHGSLPLDCLFTFDGKRLILAG